MQANSLPLLHVPIGYFLVVLLILIASCVQESKGLPFSSYWNLRRRTLEVDSTAESNKIVHVVPILEFDWDSDAFPKNGVQGFIVLSNPLNACESVEPPPSGMFDEDNNGTNWFLLVNNDDCDISIKKRNADESGFSALILPSTTATNINKTVDLGVPVKSCENSSNSSDVESEIECEFEMTETSNSALALEFKNINLYTLAVEGSEWEILRENFTYPSPHIVRIKDNPSVLYFVITITFLALTLITVITVCTISIKRITASVGECTRKRRIVRRNNLLNTTVSSLPIRKWTRALDTLSEENKVCKICMENFKDDEEIKVLPCCHIFHLNCVDQWILEGRPFCKICKHNLLPPNERMTHPSNLPIPTDTLQPVYASCESTRLLIPNSGTLTNPPPPLRVMAVMPEVFDASFEAMQPLRSPARPPPYDGEINSDISLAEGEENSIIRNPPEPSVKSGENSRSGQSKSNATNSPKNTPYDRARSSPQVQVSNIYVSDREDFV